MAEKVVRIRGPFRPAEVEWLIGEGYQMKSGRVDHAAYAVKYVDAFDRDNEHRKLELAIATARRLLDSK